MANALKNLNSQTAQKMVKDMSNRDTVMWVLAAAVVHLVLIGATSVPYMRDHWFDPAGAAAREKAAELAEATAATQPAQAVASIDTKPVAKPADPIAEDKAMLEQKKNNPEVKKVTETAKPNEIPKSPTHEGFHLDDSSLK